MEELDVQIRPTKEGELELLEEEFSPGSRSNHHFGRFYSQKSGKGIYLVAWNKNHPVGHFLLMWEGPRRDDSQGKYPKNTPYLEAGGTKEEFRRRGVATKLILEAEKLVKERGAREIGIAVGVSDNPNARRLYEKLGFKDWGQGEFTTWWEFIDSAGNKIRETEICIYMFKPL